MPIIDNKMDIQALGGNRLEWKVKFESVEDADGNISFEVTGPPCNVEVQLWNPNPPNEFPEDWSCQVVGRGEVVLEGYDIALQDVTPGGFRGYIACEWEQDTATMYLRRKNWGGAGTPFLNAGDTALLTLWLRQTDIPTVYSQGS